ncbi:HD-GYP domain-containing protein [Candidatus Solirubrobacter pratensis]|uniref:HD-GYP domain-containing protein n=1 Tax=Candidatus Solirubrobacter pratensis TaxID=1298857 RepID=UPI00040C8F70|nr:HD-GYP domain-containing protein [Candidatus Solirubrobacter pratensis]
MPTTQALDAGTERLIAEVRARREQALPARERVVEATLAAATVAAALALALVADSDRAFSLPLAVAFTAAVGIVSRVSFAVGDGRVVPTQLVFVPMLLLLPTPLVPLLVVGGMVASLAGPALRKSMPRERMLLAINDATFALAPAFVLTALGAESPSWPRWPEYIAALAAQFAADTVRETLRSYLAAGVAPRVVLQEMLEVFRIDALLVPIGLLAALAAADAPATALLVLPLVYLLVHFSREREARINQSIEMTRSFRGTALLLRDLLEQDDEYTGHHTEDVVDLSVRVAVRMGVSEAIKRETELGALLHDIGKIHIPDAIINKPGKLDEEEWAIMKTHTILGQRMLDRVGGMLTRVGLLVRASHERYDGGGYPDGLRGEEIPLGARIVAACDSFNAMTTTRSYRKALPVSHAVAELERCSGTQFDPAVVDALLAVIGDPGWTLTVREPADKPATDARLGEGPANVHDAIRA